MPGISLIYRRDGLQESDRVATNAALENMHLMPTYSSRILCEDDRLLVASSGYTNYPVREFGSGKVRVFIEGHVYGMDTSQLENRLITQAVA